MNPAALSAIVDKNLANFIAASTPGGIEAQEAQGQRDLVAAESHLPSEMSAADRSALESLGFIFGAKVDDLFVQCTFPAGWSIKPSDHSMHSDLVDPQGRKRGGIFYKAAFYDRRAYLRLHARYYQRSDYEKPTSTYFIVDSADGSRKHVVGTAPYADYDAHRLVDQTARKWLENNLPNYQDPLAYWAD
jgi:hypothetical protein